jgi:outer membrane protein OmpA-like peptidoglycan-associated protein
MCYQFIQKSIPRKLILAVLVAVSSITSLADVVPIPVVVTPQTPFYNVNYQMKLFDLLRRQGVEVNQVGRDLYIILGTDHFFKGQSTTEIVPACIPVLNNVALLLRIFTPRSIIVSGHTDNIGTDQGKLRRSKQQADTIVAYLWSQGVPLPNMIAIGYGDTRPVSSNQAVDGSAANRRIEIVAK